MMLNRSTIMVSKYLSEDVYNLIKVGYFAVYKRPNLTCAKELEELKSAIAKGIIADEAVNQKKYPLSAGHGGNLDSSATGVLAVGVCHGCKVLQTLLASNKRYTVTGQLGVATDTYNDSGKVIEEASYDHVTRDVLETTLKDFVGEIFQKPPVYSALKIGGKRASDIARSGKEVTLMQRPVMCYSARCVSFEPPFFTLDVSCGHGFYVRSLIHDLAQGVGSCAHVTGLERTQHGPFTLQDCLHPEDYTLDNVITAVKNARRNHPELAQYLKSYWNNAKKDTRLKR